MKGSNDPTSRGTLGAVTPVPDADVAAAGIKKEIPKVQTLLDRSSNAVVAGRVVAYRELPGRVGLSLKDQLLSARRGIGLHDEF